MPKGIDRGDGRDEFGHFVNRAGPGRPTREREEKYLEILIRTCTFDKWTQIIKRAIVDAMNGDKDARKWLSDYLIGPPHKRIDVTTGGEKITQDYEQTLSEAIKIVEDYSSGGDD